MMKGIILAGGVGSRLYPLTAVASKQLQAVYDKPMVYYPLSTLIESGIREFCLISTPEDLPRYRRLLGDGQQWGISIEYRKQPQPGGIAQAFIIGESFIGRHSVTLILGDNIFLQADTFSRAIAEFQTGATVFGCRVKDPEQFGVVELDSRGRALSIEEKPKRPRSSYAIPGTYIYDHHVSGIAKQLKRSPRGELEIAGVNEEYLRRGQLHVYRLPPRFVWLDAGTSSTLHEASRKIESLEKKNGIKIGSPEQAAFRQGLLSANELNGLVRKMPACEYRDSLQRIVGKGRGAAGSPGCRN
jgi:glucose-1-phosphate thymidylyltransferase